MIEILQTKRNIFFKNIFITLFYMESGVNFFLCIAKFLLRSIDEII